MPTLTVTEAVANYYYTFAVPRNTFNNAKLAYADEIFLHLLPTANNSEAASAAKTLKYKFFDSDGNVITRIPPSGDVNVAMYLEEGTYIPVISSSGSGADGNAAKSSGSSSGCNIGMNAALIMLAGLSLINLKRKIR